MRNIFLSSKDYQLFLYKAFFCLGIAWAAFLSTLVGFFHAPIIWTLALLLGAWLTKKSKLINPLFRPSRELAIVSSIFLFVAIVFSFFSTPTVFSGRDQGSFSQAAIRLAQNHKLAFSTPTSNEFFKLHQPGRALNFPGFHYDANGQLVTQFSLVYISWLALFFATFGIGGFAIANGFLLYIFFLAFYLLVRMFLKTTASIPTILFVLTSFTFMWFAKYTLSENIALPLTWLTILSLLQFVKNPRKLNFLVFLFSATLLCFARIEGLAVLIFSVAIIYFSKKAHDYLKEDMLKRVVVPAISFLTIFLVNAFVDRYFYKEIIRALLPQALMPKAQYLGSINESIFPIFYNERIFLIYGLLGFFLIGLISILKIACKKEIFKLLPLFVVLPTFIYFFDANISSDHPWMLRRYMITLLPVAIFYSGLLIGNLLEKKSSNKHKALAFVLTISLVSLNLPAFTKYLTFSENQELLDETRTLSEKFSPNDLILLDKNAAGDGWSMISDPMNSLFGKNAVYFFNTSDLIRLDTKNFDNIYLIAPLEQTGYYLNSTIGSRLLEVDSYNLNFSKLSINQNKTLESISLPEKQDFEVQGKIYKIQK